MVEVIEKKDCCGCNACYDSCEKKAISLQIDIEGFWYPVVDKNKCVDCGLCEKVCPQIHVSELKRKEFGMPVCFAAIHKDIEVRFDSTTGGMFSALAEQMYKQGGYVGGAIYREDWSVAHFISNNPDDLVRLRQSKYSQSDTRGFYKEVKRLLLAGEKVLVCGTPCQMAALRQFIHIDFENLIIVDFICKSITSPKFYAKYLDFWERKAKSKLVSFKFKDKELGWRNLVKRFDFKNGSSVYSRAQDDDLYSAAYHANIASRPSCYVCRFKGFPRYADITIADFWGCEKYKNYQRIDDNAGTSAVICNTRKGLEFYNILDNIDSIPAKIEDIIPGNPALLYQQSAPKGDRDAFFRDLDKEPIEVVVPRFVSNFCKTSNNTSLSFRQKLGRITHVLKGALRKHIDWLEFIRLNVFSKNVRTDWMNDGIIYPFKHCAIELHKGSILELHGPLDFGYKKVKGSKLESRLLLEQDSYMVINKASHFWYGTDIEVFKNAKLIIDSVGANMGCTIICGQKIEMTGHVSIGRNVSIRDTNAHLIAVEGYKILRPVLIENHVWLCSGASISPGVKIRSGAIVGANSRVVQNVHAHTLVCGNPAKIVQKNIAWKL